MAKDELPRGDLQVMGDATVSHQSHHDELFSFSPPSTLFPIHPSLLDFLLNH